MFDEDNYNQISQQGDVQLKLRIPRKWSNYWRCFPLISLTSSQAVLIHFNHMPVKNFIRSNWSVTLQHNLKITVSHWNMFHVDSLVSVLTLTPDTQSWAHSAQTLQLMCLMWWPLLQGHHHHNTPQHLELVIQTIPQPSLQIFACKISWIISQFVLVVFLNVLTLSLDRRKYVHTHILI